MLSDLTHIPRIMRRQGWLNGARLLEIWFSRPRAVAPSYSAPDTTTIRMDSWALTFPRARQVYDQLVRDRIWSNTPARQVIARMLRHKGLLANAVRSFGQLTDPVPQQDVDYINFRAAGGYTNFDDMTAALGNFTFRVVVAGTVGPAAGPQGSPGGAGYRSQKSASTSATHLILRAISIWAAGATIRTGSHRLCPPNQAASSGLRLGRPYSAPSVTGTSVNGEAGQGAAETSLSFPI